MAPHHLGASRTYSGVHLPPAGRIFPQTPNLPVSPPMPQDEGHRLSSWGQQRGQPHGPRLLTRFCPRSTPGRRLAWSPPSPRSKHLPKHPRSHCPHLSGTATSLQPPGPAPSPVCARHMQGLRGERAREPPLNGGRAHLAAAVLERTGGPPSAALGSTAPGGRTAEPGRPGTSR